LNPDSTTPASPDSPAHRIIARPDHPISRRQIAPNALRVLYRLREGGYQSYLVGGCLRDLMLGVEPKDFDVVTSASPEEVRRLFRNCRLIGRRFRLAHVFFGREIIEVATFRAATAPSQGEETEGDPDIVPEVGAEDEEPDADALPDLEADGDEADDDEADDEVADFEPQGAATGDRVLDDQGRILRDNTYGTIDEDVWRRDFTCNALYYNIEDFSLRDYVGAFEDIQARRLRLIGDPETRYREDPVRMLRAARFEAKLGFTLDPETEAPIAKLRELLGDVPPARLFDESLKLFLTGHGLSSLSVLRRRGLLGALFPTVEAALARYAGGPVETLLTAGLANTDERVRGDKPVTPTFLFALLLYGPIAMRIEAMAPEHWHDPGAILDACDAAIDEAQERVTIPRRFALGVREMYALQPRLEMPRGRRALRLIELPRFRAAFDLLLLRAAAGLAAPETAQWWTRLQEVGGAQRQAMIDALERSQSRAQGGASGTGGGGGGSSGSGGSGRPRRRRRRR
jgi:poly(A) polymerase